MKALQIDRYGSLGDLAVRDVPDGPLPPGEIRVEVEAAGLNPSDVGVALGRFPAVTLPRILGRDFAGRIVAGPPGSIGTLVWGSGGGRLGMTRDGSHAEYLDLPADAVAVRPARLGAVQAAAMGVPYVTAWSALVDLAALGEGEWAIVSGAAGAVGRAAVQIAKARGARAIALVKDATGRAALDDLRPDAIAQSDLGDLSSVVSGATGGKMANVALNVVGAPVFTPMLDALAKGGRMVIVSAAAGREVQLDLFAFYRNERKLFGLDTAKLDLAQVASILGELAPLIESGTLVPPVAECVPLSHAREAYRRVEAGGAGKIVLIPDRLL